MTPGSSMTIAAQKNSRRSRPPARPAGLGVFPAASGQPQAAATFTFPNRILFDPGARKLLAGELARLGITRPLVVTDPGLVASRAHGDGRRPAGEAGGRSSATWRPTRQKTTCSPDWNTYRDRRLATALVAIGGGSAIDAAKAIRLLVTHPGRLADYDLTRGGQEKITAVSSTAWRPFPPRRGQAARWAEGR